MKRRLFFAAILFCILASSIVLASCNIVGTHSVRYLITGPDTVANRVMYANETGNLDQITDVPIPWEKTITVQGRRSVSCSAVILYNTSTYTAKIFVDGKEIATASSQSSSITVTGLTE